MDTQAPNPSASERPSSKGVRRFWIAWLIFLITLLAAFTVIILIAAVASDSGNIPP